MMNEESQQLAAARTREMLESLQKPVGRRTVVRIKMQGIGPHRGCQAPSKAGLRAGEVGGGDVVLERRPFAKCALHHVGQVGQTKTFGGGTAAIVPIDRREHGKDLVWFFLRQVCDATKYVPATACLEQLQAKLTASP